MIHKQVLIQGDVVNEREKSTTKEMVERQRSCILGGLLTWFIAERVFGYHSTFALYLLLFLGFVWFVLPDLLSGIKQISLEAVEEALTKPNPDRAATLSSIPDSLKELRDRLGRLDFEPYSVNIWFDYRNVGELLQRVGFTDGKQWINGMELGEAKPDRQLGQGIDFVVLSADWHRNPRLVCRCDGEKPSFQTGLDELSRTIQTVCFKERDKLFGPTTWHPELFFGRRPGRRSLGDSYEIGITVRRNWWDKIPNNPTDLECHEDYTTGSLYIVLARIPIEEIHGVDWELTTDESLRESRNRLEKLGWKPFEEPELGILRHKYFTICRQELNGRSVVGHAIEWGSKEIPEHVQV